MSGRGPHGPNGDGDAGDADTDQGRALSALTWWIVAINAAFLLSFSIVVPIFRGPDEMVHISRLTEAGSERGAPDPTVLGRVTPEVMKAAHSVGPLPPVRPPMRSEQIPPRGERPRFDEFDTSSIKTQLPDQMDQHPPLYYQATSAVTGAVTMFGPATMWPWDREVYIYRLMSVLCMVAIPALGALAARFAGLSAPSQAFAALVAAAVGGATFLGSVVHNGPLTALWCAWLILAVVAFRSTGRSMWLLSASVAAAASMLTKTTSLTVVTACGLLLAIELVRRFRDPLAEVPWNAVAASLAIGVVGMSWHLQNLVRTGDPQPNGLARTESLPGTETDVPAFLQEWVARLWASFWGEPGLRTGIHGAYPIMWILSALVIAGMLVALWRWRDNAYVVLGLGSVWALQVGVVFATNLRRHLIDGDVKGIQGVQGRYLFPAIVAMAVVCAFGHEHLRRRATARFTWAYFASVAVFAVVLHLTLEYSMLTRFWASIDGSTRGNYETMLAWSPWSTGISIVLFWLPALALLGAVVYSGSTRYAFSRRRGRTTS